MRARAAHLASGTEDLAQGDELVEVVGEHRRRPADSAAAVTRALGASLPECARMPSRAFAERPTKHAATVLPASATSRAAARTSGASTNPSMKTRTDVRLRVGGEEAQVVPRGRDGLGSAADERRERDASTAVHEGLDHGAALRDDSDATAAHVRGNGADVRHGAT